MAQWRQDSGGVPTARTERMKVLEREKGQLCKVVGVLTGLPPLIGPPVMFVQAGAPPRICSLVSDVLHRFSTEKAQRLRAPIFWDAVGVFLPPFKLDSAARH